MIKAGVNAYTHRKSKKSDFRRLWQIKINAAVRQHGLSYSTFMKALKQHNIGLDRKVLALLVEHEPTAFERIVAKVK